MKGLDTKYMERNQYHKGKNLQDIYTGVDVFGRQSHGDGGLGAYKAIEHLDPQGVGLSVALFAPGWTWENTVSNFGWDWEQWWQFDTKLWVGVPAGTVQVVQHHYKPNELRCDHGPFKPLTTFFPTLPPPDPLDLAFYTTFSPGIGNSWFVQGERVFTSEQGWMDVDKQTSIGDLVWPRPNIYDEGKEVETAVTSSSFIFQDAWSGGNSLQLHTSLPKGHSSSVWLPIQSLSLTSRVKYEASVVFKFHYPQVTLKPGVRSKNGEGATITSASTISLGYFWQRTTVIFEIGEVPSGSASSIVPSAIGFTISPFLHSENAIDFKFLVGELTVHPHLPPEYRDFQTSIFWITFLATSINATSLEGTLEWEVGAILPHVPDFDLPGTEDPSLPWSVQPTNQNWFPEFRYFNVYALTERREVKEAAPWVAGLSQMEATWLGTTGYAGRKDRFFVHEENVAEIAGSGRVIFQVEGVLETGEVIRWNDTTAPVSISQGPVQKPQAQPQESANKSHTLLSDARLGPAGGQLPYSLLALVCVIAYLFITSILYRIYRFRNEKRRRAALDL